MEFKNEYMIEKSKILSNINKINKDILLNYEENFFNKIKFNNTINMPPAINFNIADIRKELDDLKNNNENLSINLDKREDKHVKIDIDLSVIETLKDEILKKDEIIKYLKSQDYIDNRSKILEFENNCKHLQSENTRLKWEVSDLKINFSEFKNKKFFGNDLIVIELNNLKSENQSIKEENINKDSLINDLKNQIEFLKSNGESSKIINKLKENYEFLNSKYNKLVENKNIYIENIQYKIKEKLDNELILTKL